MQPGDNFWSIAQSVLADAWDRTPTSAETIPYWRALVDGNRDLLDPPHDPNLIYPGQVFHLPAIPHDPTNPIEPEAEAEVAPEPVAPPPPTGCPAGGRRGPRAAWRRAAR